jgi:hypothetical protein
VQKKLAYAAGHAFRPPIAASVFRRDRDAKPSKRIIEANLTGQSRRRRAMIGAVEKLVFVLLYLRQLVYKSRITIHVTGRAGAAAAAQREPIVDARTTNNLHDGQSGLAVNGHLGTLSRRYNKLRHVCLPDKIKQSAFQRKWSAMLVEMNNARWLLARIRQLDAVVWQDKP